MKPLTATLDVKREALRVFQEIVVEIIFSFPKLDICVCVCSCIV